MSILYVIYQNSIRWSKHTHVPHIHAYIRTSDNIVCTCIHTCRLIYTVPTGPNLTESEIKPDLGFALGVRSGSARADPEQSWTGPHADAKQTQRGPRADAKQTSKAKLQIQKRTHKADPWSASHNTAFN